MLMHRSCGRERKKEEGDMVNLGNADARDGGVEVASGCGRSRQCCRGVASLDTMRTHAFVEQSRQLGKPRSFRSTSIA